MDTISNNGSTDDKYLQALIDQSRNFVIAIDMDMILKSFNKSSIVLFKQFGIDLKKGGKFENYLDMFPEKLVNVQRALNGETFSIVESWDTAFFQTEYCPLFDSQGTKIGASLIGRYMNGWDEKEMEEVVLGKEEKDFFWPHVVVFGRSSQSHSFSRQASWEKHTGQSFEEYNGYGWLNAHHQDFRPKATQIWQAVRACKKPRAFSFLSFVWNAKLKMYRHTLIHSTPQYDSQGNVSYWTCAGIDVHELRQLQEDLAITTQRLRMILEAGQIGTWDWDLATGTIKGDRSHSMLFGREFTGGAFDGEDLMAQVIDRSTVETAIKNSIDQGVPYDCEFQVRLPDGSFRWVGGRGEVHQTKEGRNCLLGVNWDITARKQMQEERVRFLKHEEEIRSSKQAEEFERKRAEEAEENQRRQEEFIDTVCHEIRNPLVGIYGGVHLATEELTSILNLPTVQERAIVSMERIKLHLNSILRCAEQQKVLVDDVLDMSKLTNNKIMLVPVPFQLSNSLELVMDMFRSRMQEKNLNLNVQLPSDDIFIKADMNRFQQVIINMVSNAVKFTHKGEITVSADVRELDGKFIVDASVQDTGIGICEKEIPILFDRFSQVRNKKRIQYGGTGLGLAISKRLVEAMGGKITVESTPGRGTKFFFSIKADKVTHGEVLSLMQEETTQEFSEVPTTKHILVVDDNSLNQKILACYLEKAGHTVQVASDGFEAVQKAAQQYFDIIFMDIEMPNMNGLEATMALRQREQELNIRSTIIGLSGNARKEKIDAALDSGMDFYLTKPYHRDEIMQAIAKVGEQTSHRPRVRKSIETDMDRMSKHQKIDGFGE